MSPRNLLWSLALSVSLISGCGPAETPASQEGSLAAIESRLGSIEARLDANASSAPSVSGEVLKEISVQPPAFAMTVGSQQKIELMTLTTESGEASVLTGFSVVDFSMEDTEIAAVSKSGEITALKPGTTILVIRLGSMTKSLPVVVTAGVTPTPTATPVPTTTPTPEPTPTPSATPLPSNNIKSISLSPDAMDLNVNDTEVISKIFVTLNDEEESIGSLNSVDLAELRSNNTAVATVSTNGVVTAIGEGSTTIVATYKGIEGRLTVTVSDDDE